MSQQVWARRLLPAVLLGLLLGVAILAWHAAPLRALVPVRATEPPTFMRVRGPVGAAPPGIAAVVNGEEIPLWEYHALLELNKENAAAAGASVVTRTLQAATVAQIVNESLLNAYAQAHALAAARGQVDARMEAYLVEGEGQFNALLARLGVSRGQFHQLVTRNMNAQRVTVRVVDRLVAPPTGVQVYQVVLPTRARAVATRQELAIGVSPVILVARGDLDPVSRRLNGQLPALTRAQGDALYGPQWDKAAFALAPDAIGEPVHVRQGWAVMEGIERLRPTPLMGSTMERFMRGLRRGSRIVVYVHPS